MLKRWTERLPPLRGDLTTLREVAASDVYSLFTLLSDPAVSAYMAPPPPTLAKFAGFVEWSHQQRAQGDGLCFGVVPDGMTAAVMPSGTTPKQRPSPCARCWCDHSTNPANLARVGGGGAMYAETAGSESRVKSEYTSDAATSRSVVRSPRRGGRRSVHRLSIDVGY